MVGSHSEKVTESHEITPSLSWQHIGVAINVGHTCARTHVCARSHVPFYTSSCQKVARLSAVQGRTTDIADHNSLACTMLVHMFVAHLIEARALDGAS